MYISIALRGGVKKGVPRKKPEEYIEVAKKLKGKVDVLLIHDSPKLPLPEYSFGANDGRAQAVGIAIYETKPRIVFCGHLHIEKPYTICRHECGTLYVRIDSSQRHKAYAVLHASDERLEIRRDQEVFEEQDL